MGSLKTTVLVWIGRLQGNNKKRRKEVVPYPLLDESEKNSKKSYSLKSNVNSYYAEA